VRSRLYFTSTKGRDDKEPDADVRELRVMKSNYGPPGEVVRLRWQRGVFVPESSADPLNRAATAFDVDRAYLECLDAATAQGRRAFPGKGKGFAPSMFADMPQARGHLWRALAKAQERLFAAGKIQVTPEGPPSRVVRFISRKVQ
jgi:RecA-family ATPase